MTIWACVIAGFLVLDFVVKVVATWLTVRTAAADVPAEFVGVYDAAAYQRSLQYARASQLRGIAAGGFTLAVLFGFWRCGGFNALDSWVRGWGLPELTTGVVYVGALLLAGAFLTLPFHAYQTLGVNQRFGFNRMTLVAYAADRLKWLMVAVVVGGLVLSSLLAALQWFGPWAWLGVWVTVSGAYLISAFVFPTWIEPLFRKHRRLEGPLRERLAALSWRLGFPIQRMYVAVESRRSSKVNARFLGFGSSRRVVLFDTLVSQSAPAQITADEVEAIVAHEIGHYRLHHLPWRLGLMTLYFGVLSFLLAVCLDRPQLFAAFGMAHSSAYAGLYFFLLLATPVGRAVEVALNLVCRWQEYQADAFAAIAVGNPELVAAALKGIVRSNLVNLQPHPLEVALYHHHPTMPQRVAALRRLGRRAASLRS